MTMGDIIREVEEDLRRDRYEQLARTYGPHLLVVVTLLIAAAGGYAGWRNWRDTRNQEQTEQIARAVIGRTGAGADARLDALVAAARDVDAGKAALVRMVEAGVRLSETGDREPALAVYQTLGQRSDAPALQDLARLLEVMHRLKDGDPDTLNAALAPLMVPGQPWRPMAQELMALLALRTGEPARAVRLFEELAADPAAPPALRQRAGELAALHAPPGSSSGTPDSGQTTKGGLP